MCMSESSGDFVGRLWTVSDGNQPPLSSLLSTNSSMRSPCTIFSQNQRRGESKQKGHIFYLCVKSAVKGGKEGGSAGRITLSAGWYHSIHADQFSQTEGDERGAGARRREEGELKWWSYWSVKEIQRCVFCLNVHINLSCQRWAGTYWHLATDTWIVDFLPDLAVHSCAHQLHVETEKKSAAPTHSLLCSAQKVPNQLWNMRLINRNWSRFKVLTALWRKKKHECNPTVLPFWIFQKYLWIF